MGEKALLELSDGLKIYVVSGSSLTVPLIGSFGIANQKLIVRWYLNHKAIEEETLSHKASSMSDENLVPDLEELFEERRIKESLPSEARARLVPNSIDLNFIEELKALSMI